MSYSVVLKSSEETEDLGEQLGRNLRGGEIIQLVSDVGGGKTTMTRGIAKGAGSLDRVGSPTFTLSKVYQAPHFEIHHFDFYRLNDPGIVRLELADVLEAKQQVVVVLEWADSVKDVLQDRPVCTIKINKLADDFNRRQLQIIYPKSLSYLGEGIC